MSSLKVMLLLKKATVLGMRYLPGIRRGPSGLQTAQDIAVTIGCPPELYGKTPLLKINTSVGCKTYRRLALSRKLSP